MILLSWITISYICVGMGIAALAGYPLYWGLLAGWLCPSVAIMLVVPSYMVISRIVTEVRRHRDKAPVIPWREQRKLKVGNRNSFQEKQGAFCRVMPRKRGVVDRRWYVVPPQKNIGLGTHTRAGLRTCPGWDRVLGDVASHGNRRALRA
jgi:hypothetical protein